MKCILDYLLGINVYISFILSLSRHNMSRTVSIWFKMSMVHMTPVPSLHSDFFMRLMQWKNIFSCYNLVVGGMIMDVVNIKYVSKC